MQDNDDSTSFLRQRRDLFVISAILLLIPLAEIKSNGLLNIPTIGISMTIGKPEVIMTALWIMWIYWYFRLYQSFKKLRRNFVSESYYQISLKYFYEKFDIEYQKLSSQILKEYADKNKINISEVKIHAGRRPFDLQPVLNKYSLEFTFKPIIHVAINNAQVEANKMSLKIEFISFVWIKLKSAVVLIFTELDFTEYYFPFIFGLLPIIYKLYTQIKCI